MMNSLTSFLMFVLALCLFCTTTTHARSSFTHVTKMDKPRAQKGFKSDVKKAYDVYDILDEGLLLIQGLLSREESLPTEKVEDSWPGQRLDWYGDVRTQSEMNMMGM